MKKEKTANELYYSNLMLSLIAKYPEEKIKIRTLSVEMLVEETKDRSIKKMSSEQKKKLKEEVFLRLTHMTSYYDKEEFTKKEVLDYLMLKWM